MKPDRASEIDRLFQSALDCKREQRSTFLRDACAGNDALRREVEALLLHADARRSLFLSEPALHVAARAAAGAAMIGVGTRVGPYEVVGRLGSGGMGDVYRARDSQLRRDVAIKVLSPIFASDPERLARFERESRVLASLNHPHIAAIYAVESVGATRALVLELVEGETLAERIARGPLSVRDALSVACEIADAIAAAHQQGVVHRDLKPANIKFARDGAVKVLDFGLAKATVGDGPGPDVSQLTTLTLNQTDARLIVGTIGYMSPEQASGLPTDARTDIWAFGCVLFEMLTGHRAFEGRDSSETFAAMLLREPRWDALPAQVPESVRRLIQRCLERDPHRRLGDIAAARFVLEEIANLGGRSTIAELASASAEGSPQPTWRRVGVASAIALAVGAAIAAGVVRLLTQPAQLAVTRSTFALTGPRALAVNTPDRPFALSPDGLRLVYVGNNGTQLFVRTIDALDPVAIATGTNLRSPFVSPDGQWVAFFEGGTLKKMRMTGGTPITLAQFDLAAGMRGAAWASDAALIVATNRPTTGVLVVPAEGGTPVVLTKPDQARGEVQYLWPEPLPGGRAVLFTITAQVSGPEAASVAVLDLRTRDRKIVLRGGTHAQYLPSGHLVYAAAGTLRAVSFDLARLEVRGTDALVVPRLLTMPQGGAGFAVAGSGTLVYLDAPVGGRPDSSRALVWVDRSGNEEPIPAPPRAYVYPRLSPDGMRLALDVRDQDNDIWIWDFQRATLTRLTIDPSQDRAPEWTRDSRRIIFFTSDRSGSDNLWWQAADGSGAPERLITSAYPQFVTGTTPDGTAALFFEGTATQGQDLMQVTLDGSRRVTPVLQTISIQRHGVVSPDGRWIAYDSDSSGQEEVYVRPFPNTSAGQWQVSTGGGTRPLWAPHGRELFYVAPAPDHALMTVGVEANNTIWHARTPVKLLSGRYLASSPQRNYDVSADGQRFVMIKATASGEAAQPSIVLVQRWEEELRRLAPAK